MTNPYLSPYMLGKINTLDELAYFTGLPRTLYGTSPYLIFDLEIVNDSCDYKDFRYSINPYGYRGDWTHILDPNIKKIGFFGCSFTFGQSCPDDYIFSTVVQKLLKNKYQSFNFGTCGSNHFHLGRLLNAVTNFINLDYAVFLLPTKNRFLTLNDEYSLVNLLPTNDETGYHRYTGSFKDWYKCIGDDNLTLIQLDYIMWMLDRCLSKKIIPLFSSWDNDTYELLLKNIPETYLLKQFAFNGKDKRFLGRDMLHPGILAHQIFGSYIVDKLKVI